MHTNSAKAGAFVIGVLAVGVLGYVSGVTSPAVWAILLTVAVVPAVVVMRLSRARSQSMSESIREALR
jgi:hypothetical protein